MIATLSGKILEKIGDVIVIDCRGVGYGVLVTFEDFGALHSGELAKLYIHENIRETAHDRPDGRTARAARLGEVPRLERGVRALPARRRPRRQRHGQPE